MKQWKNWIICYVVQELVIGINLMFFIVFIFFFVGWHCYADKQLLRDVTEYIQNK